MSFFTITVAININFVATPCSERCLLCALMILSLYSMQFTSINTSGFYKLHHLYRHSLATKKRKLFI